MKLFEISHYYPYDGGRSIQLFHLNKKDEDFKSDIQTVLIQFVNNITHICDTLIDTTDIVDHIIETLCKDFNYEKIEKYTLYFRDTYLYELGSSYDGISSIDKTRKEFDLEGCKLLKELLTEEQIDKILVYNDNILIKEFQDKSNREKLKSDIAKYLLDHNDPTISSMIKIHCDVCKVSDTNIIRYVEIYDILADYINIETAGIRSLEDLNEFLSQHSDHKISSKEDLINIISNVKGIMK